MELKNINTVGVIMFGLLGDVLMRTPVLRALRELYPDAKIVSICDVQTKNVLKDNPCVDKFIFFDRRKTISKIVGAFRVRAFKFDLLVDLYNGGSSANIALFSTARYKLGYADNKRNSYYNILSAGILKKQKSICSYNEQMLSILEPLTDKNFNPSPIFIVRDNIKESMSMYMKDLGENRDKIYTLNLGSGGLEKILDYEMYFELVKYIYDKYDYIPAVVSNPSQEYLQEDLIYNFLKPNSIPFIKLKPLSIEEVGAFVKHSRFIITPDTGLLHISIACECNILAIFNYTNPALVDFGYDKLVAIYENFNQNALFKEQQISLQTLYKCSDELMLRV